MQSLIVIEDYLKNFWTKNHKFVRPKNCRISRSVKRVIRTIVWLSDLFPSSQLVNKLSLTLVWATKPAPLKPGLTINYSSRLLFSLQLSQLLHIFSWKWDGEMVIKCMQCVLVKCLRKWLFLQVSEIRKRRWWHRRREQIFGKKIFANLVKII